MLDSIDVKEIAIICAEHQKLKIENPLLKEQISSYIRLNELNEKTDSIQKEEISLYKKEVDSNYKEIQKLKTSKRRIIIGSSIGGLLLFILGLML